MIIKYSASCTTLFDTLEDNGAPQALDAILINNVLDSDFPIFDLETESAGEANERKAGEWGGTFSFLQTETSSTDDGLNDFFRGGTRDYKYIIMMQAGATIFHGKFNSSDLAFDFTYSQGKYEVKFIARDLIEELAIYLETLSSQFDISHFDTFSFEDYMSLFHLDGLNVNFIGDTLSHRVGQEVSFKGSIYDAIDAVTDMTGVSRLETFKGLSRGLGFTYDLSVNMALQDIYDDSSQWYPRSFIQINIDWISDANTADALEIIQTEKHLERLTPKSNRYLFIGYRNMVSTAFPEVDENNFTAVRGILFDGENIVAESDSGDNSNPIYAYYPFFYFPLTDDAAPDGNNIRGNQFAFYEHRHPYPDVPPIYNISDVTFIDLEKYAYSDSGGQEAWLPGVVAYSRIFSTSTGFLPIQRFVVEQYKRYLFKAGKKVKTLKIPVTDTMDIKHYKTLSITDDQEQAYYFTGKISGYSPKDKMIELESTQI